MEYQVGDLIRYRGPIYGIDLAIVYEIDIYTNLIGVMFLDYDEIEWHFPDAIDEQFENLSNKDKQ